MQDSIKTGTLPEEPRSSVCQHLTPPSLHRSSATRRKPEHVSSTYLRLRSLCVSHRVGPLSQSENTARAGEESSRDAAGGVGR